MAGNRSAFEPLWSQGFTTQIGGDRITSFDTVASKCRLMFLMTLRGEFQDYVINAAALVYLHEMGAPPALIDQEARSIPVVA